MFALESKKKKVVQTFCPTTVGISSDIGKLCSANVQSLTVIFRPESTILWNPHILCMNMYDENQAQGWSMDQVHESGPWTRSMDQVHGPQGGPWTGSTGVVHGSGSMFCIRPDSRAQILLNPTPQEAVNSRIPSIYFAFSRIPKNNLPDPAWRLEKTGFQFIGYRDTV